MKITIDISPRTAAAIVNHVSAETNLEGILSTISCHAAVEYMIQAYLVSAGLVAEATADPGSVEALIKHIAQMTP